MAPEKIISLMTDRQLNDIVRFCTKPDAIPIFKELIQHIISGLAMLQ